MLINLTLLELQVVRALLLDQRAIAEAHITAQVQEALVIRLHQAIADLTTVSPYVN
jgi:hypothetical protein